jgi:hypothetical protein
MREDGITSPRDMNQPASRWEKLLVQVGEKLLVHRLVNMGKYTSTVSGRNCPAKQYSPVVEFVYVYLSRDDRVLTGWKALCRL